MTKSEYNRRWYIINRKKKLKYAKLYQQKNHEKCKLRWRLYSKKNKKKRNQYSRFWKFKKKYGLSKEGYENLLIRQKNKCAICGSLLSTDSRQIHVDHDHKTGKVRGIVHQSCNLTLGFSNENIETLKSVIRYIQRHSTK